MGTRVYERSFTCESQRQSSNNCSGTISGQCCRKTSVLFFLFEFHNSFLRVSYLVHDLQTAKEYSEQLGVDACIKLFEQFKSYEGLYFFLGAYLSSRYFFLIGMEHDFISLFTPVSQF